MFITRVKGNHILDRENDRQMLLPLFILTAPSVFLGLFIYDPLMMGFLFQNSLAANELVLSFYNNYVINSLQFFIHSFTTINFLILLAGLIFSYFYYYKKAFDISVPALLGHSWKKNMDLIIFLEISYLRFKAIFLDFCGKMLIYLRLTMD